MFKPNVGVFGYGEVGKSICELVDNSKKFKLYIEDTAYNKFIDRYDINYHLYAAHICFPYNDKFEDFLRKIIYEFKPFIIIVHSTVPIGTINKFNDLETKIVHSPVRGVHPRLSKYMKEFVTFIGYDNLISGEEAFYYLSKLGMKCELVRDSQNTEAGKLLDTLYYGVCIEYHRFMQQVCNKFGLDYSVVATRFNQTYNEGYKNTKPNVIRPVLNPPEGKIGGHCILPNVKILDQQISNDILDLVLKNNDLK